MSSLLSLPAASTTSTRPTLNPALKSFWIQQARNRVLFGGRDSSKSWDAAGIAIARAQWSRERILCTREFQNKIADSVYTLLKIQIERFGLRKRFAIYDNRIECPETGTDFIFYGRARNIDDIKGLEGITIHWAEECQLITQDEWIVIDATLRKEGSEHWLIFNPQLATDFVYQKFVVSPPPETIVRHINYNENPFLSNTSRKVIEHMERTDPDLHAYVYLGIPKAESDQVIIKRAWIEAAIDAHLTLGFTGSGLKKVGFDVADSGDDKCANIYAYGSIVEWGEEWRGKEDELLKSCSRTYQNATERGAEIFYDCIGVGAMAGAKFEEINEAQNAGVKYTKFNAGGAVENKEEYYVWEGMIKNEDYFSNLKAQTWWTVADRFRNTYNAIKNGEKFEVDELISISSDFPLLDKLKTELSTPLRDFDQNGRVKVESKKDLAKREVKSPNLADAFVMCFSPQAPSGFFG